MFKQLPRPRLALLALLLAGILVVVGLVQVRSGTELDAVALAFRGHRESARAAAPAETTTTAPATTEPPVTTTLPPTTTTAAPAPEPVAPAAATPVVPSGKGMWIWQPEYVEGGDPNAIVARAQAVGLTHLYVRTGSSVDGFVGQPFLDALLPVAHAAGIRVIGWDFPYFDDVALDVLRAAEATWYTTPTGDRLDGFSADIETVYEGVNLTADNAALYGSALRSAVGPNYLLIATVPRPSVHRQADYPYPEVVTWFDAIAPMVYWIDVAPDGAATESLAFLAQYGKPILPIGQAYDGGLEGGTPGTPTPDEIDAFMNASAAGGARGISFWSWQHATDEMWAAIASGVTPTG